MAAPTSHRPRTPRIFVPLTVAVAIASLTQPASGSGRPGGGTERWVAQFALGYIAHAVVTSPNGSRVYVGGESDPGRYATVAYDAATGLKVWSAAYPGPSGGGGSAYDMGISPDGGVVYVTGWGPGQDGSFGDYGTVAYDAATGTTLWDADWDGPDGNDEAGDYATLLAVDPTGERVFVSGESWADATAFDYETVAYDALTGAELWTARYGGTFSGAYDDPHGIAASPDGTAVYVTGESPGPLRDYATVAYDAASGVQLWDARYNRVGDVAYAVTVNPSGTLVLVTGCSGSWDYCVNADIVTIAYDAATGIEVWRARFAGPGRGQDIGQAVEVSPDGSSVYVAGRTIGLTGTYDFAVLAYEAATGARRWRGVFNLNGNDDWASDLAVAPDGSKVFVTGQTALGYYPSDVATAAFDATTGVRTWSAVYNDQDDSYDWGNAIAASPDGSTVYVTGTAVGTNYDFITIAYDA